MLKGASNFKTALLNWFADGRMRKIETNEPFEFEVKEGDRSYNQRRYEALGEVSTFPSTICNVEKKTFQVTVCYQQLYCMTNVTFWKLCNSS